MKRDPAYAELHCISNYSFLRGASHPEELVARAAEQGYTALALTDECSLAGVVRAHQEARRQGLKLIIGTEIRLTGGPRLVLLARNRRGYVQLCRLITRGRRRADKGHYVLARADLEQGLEDCLALLLLRWGEDAAAGWFQSCFAGRGWLALGLLRDGRDTGLLRQARHLSERHRLPLVAVGHVLMHRRGRRMLRDLLTAIRHGCTIDALGWRALDNGERHLRSRENLAALYPQELMQQALVIAGQCDFSLDELAYEYPDDVTPAGMSAQDYLRSLVEEGIRRRWPQGCPEKVRRQIEHELPLIAELNYAAYFLTVWDLVAFARQRGILCQGRGSAANSAVCYCLGITEVDPARMNLLFERFISRERGEPPDIDVDFEHERREEVIQYIYEKYGRERAALAATVISYRPRSALRDVGKALGLTTGQLEQLARAASGWRSHREVQGEWLREQGFDPDSKLIRRLLYLVNEIQGFPRHLSQHVGGFVISRGGLDELVPVENAAMPDRSIIQWDKDDLEALGLLKVDVLALGMLSAIRRALVMLGRELQDIPAEDPRVYDMICRADTVGVFQIESRAQMSMLPRLRPRCFYDLVVEVAIVRPGPIQGDMVHPYLRRRQGLEAVDYPSDAVRDVLARTLGVPIFQEQVIRLTQVAAGFSPGEADQIRRSMAAWRRRGGMEVWERKLKAGMQARGYSVAFAERIFRQIQGFGEYGFPESHAASFALLVYVSAWIKCHHPAVFACALLNSQPMGFYAPAQLVRDAREHGVEVLPVDVLHSDWDCRLEGSVLRLGLRLVKGLSRAGAERLVTERGQADFSSVQELAARTGIRSSDLKALAAADALASLEADRYRANWAVAGSESGLPLLQAAAFAEARPDLPVPDEASQVLADYAHLGLSLRTHPLALLRPELGRLRFLPAEEVGHRKPGSMVRAAGLVLTRQRPGKGNAVFITLEDETGTLNLIVWRHLAERQRQVLLGAKLLGVWAEIQRAEGVQHLVVRRLYDYSGLLGELPLHSRDFR
ncbi:error-prone DNA polymerase [Thiolapillus brandeum]|uniref:Error-prone DNA polymerase n=1 Tax=Thiolapillus brandeum TaxID=1076588 RepID=A0A7U6GHH4_9GAMM|nr:error-prone DNA polymerase [Thiolapillus brandeum]BAO43728.1 DNA polymerase III subunit alpha [Thiolapillus brandeum]